MQCSLLVLWGYCWGRTGQEQVSEGWASEVRWRDEKTWIGLSVYLGWVVDYLYVGRSVGPSKPFRPSLVLLMSAMPEQGKYEYIRVCRYRGAGEECRGGTKLLGSKRTLRRRRGVRMYCDEDQQVRETEKENSSPFVRGCPLTSLTCNVCSSSDCIRCDETSLWVSHSDQREPPLLAIFGRKMQQKCVIANKVCVWFARGEGTEARIANVVYGLEDRDSRVNLSRCRSMKPGIGWSPVSNDSLQIQILRSFC